MKGYGKRVGFGSVLEMANLLTVDIFQISANIHFYEPQTAIGCN